MGKKKARAVPEPQKQSDEKKKVNPPKLESTPAKLWKDENGETQWVLDNERCAKSHPYKDVSGIKDIELALSITTSAQAAIAPFMDNVRATNVVLQSLNDFKPENAAEARLVMQAMAAYEHGMSLIRVAAKEDMICHIESFSNLGIKFMRVHNETIEVLNRLRRGGEQKVTVTHIADKMAVVNNYGCQEGGGVKEKTGDNPCSPKNAAPKPEQINTSHADSQQWPTEDADSTAESVQVPRPEKDSGGSSRPI